MTRIVHVLANKSLTRTLLQEGDPNTSQGQAISPFATLWALFHPKENASNDLYTSEKLIEDKIEGGKKQDEIELSEKKE